MKSSKFSVPVISVGNLSMGGTGKTPHIEYLIRLLKDDYKVATLSRGFGRKVRGFQIADKDSTAISIGDEPLQYYKKFGNDITVAVEVDRVLGAMDLFRQKEDTQALLLDDAFQHRSIHSGVNILLTDYSFPYFSDFILPAGNLRESRKGKKRADIIIVTKCPGLTDSEKKPIVDRINPSKNQAVFFSKVVYGKVFSFDSSEQEIRDRKIILVTGIAKANPLRQMLAKKGILIKHFEFGDHHNFKGTELDEIHKLFDKFAEENPLIITTEKDAMRLLSEEFEEKIATYPWCYQSIEIEIDRQEEFDKLIKDYVKENNTVS
jgi:tetraacyldisaccharide 4'-kinase